MTTPTRSDLLSLLSEACELEHALACSYLFAAFSLKQGPEDGLTWEQQQLTRQWAAQIYFVASQEMLHLAQAWNLLNAVGGEPYYHREAFPHPSGYYPVPAEMTLTSCTPETIARFIVWETPRQIAPPGTTVGALYDQIDGAFRALPPHTLFLGDPRLQIDRTLADFPDLLAVHDRGSADAAIRSIQHQGEGTRADHADCHYGVFLGIQRGMEAAKFRAAREVVDNPGNYAVTDASSRAAMDLFDDIYAWMLRSLAWVFGPGDPALPETRALARSAIASMPLLIKPLGEALTALPTGDGHRVGAAFDLHRHVHLPQEPRAALQIARERLGDLTKAAQDLGARLPVLTWLQRQLGVVGDILHHP